MILALDYKALLAEEILDQKPGFVGMGGLARKVVDKNRLARFVEDIHSHTLT